MAEDQKSIMAALAAPFAESEVKWKAGKVSGTRALAFAYIDARAVQDRLDQVLGPENWQDRYEVLANGSVLAQLKLRLDGEWISKMDIGSRPDHGNAGDRSKAAVSDALKRAAVKFGIGRYLYRLPLQWVDYDPERKRLLRIPQLPPWACENKPNSNDKLDAPQRTNQRSGPNNTLDKELERMDAEATESGYGAGEFYEAVVAEVSREAGVGERADEWPPELHERIADYARSRLQHWIRHKHVNQMAESGQLDFDSD